ncbi:NifU family protein [Rhodocyclus tenuis]|uniref:NifU family protein n=1 Tax=Rhodocyclus tenuis TaxID=1066 RepID=A0A6L5JZ35_RHOTE|nr:NifU family protein [Rhodocyclus gracilis]MQY52356.1 NifU family protein [Rhodocyclus gracilis]MRD73953.1 NifU family protein [Rhodocyclus gracilis]
MMSHAEIRAEAITAADQPTIESILATLRPGVEADGGTLELVSASGDTVIVRLGGQCRGCLQAGETLGLLRRRLMHALGKAVRVLPALDH